jgi:hypothetical protein
MSKPKLYLGTIFIDRGAVPAFYYSLAKLIEEDAVSVTRSMTGHGDGAMRQLNRRVEEFLNHTTDDYFWLQGNDTDFQPGYIEHMAKTRAPVVGGLVPIKQPELRWGYQALNDGERKTDLVTGLLEVRSCILESFMIHRDVFTALQKSRPDLDYTGNHGNAAPYKLHHHWRWELAGRGPVGTPADEEWQHRLLQSEDYFICDEIRALGFKILLDTTGYCGHWDCRVRFPLVPPEPAGDLLDANGRPVGEARD